MGSSCKGNGEILPRRRRDAEEQKGKRQKGKAKVVGAISAYLHQKAKVALTDPPLPARPANPVPSTHLPGEGPGVRAKCRR